MSDTYRAHVLYECDQCHRREGRSVAAMQSTYGLVPANPLPPAADGEGGWNRVLPAGWQRVSLIFTGRGSTSPALLCSQGCAVAWLLSNFPPR